MKKNIEKQITKDEEMNSKTYIKRHSVIDLTRKFDINKANFFQQFKRNSE